MLADVLLPPSIDFRRTVDLHLAVCHDRLDLALLLQVLQASACQRAVDLESVNQGGDSDQTVGLDVLVQLLGGVLVEDDGVLGLVLDCCVKIRISIRDSQVQ